MAKTIKVISGQLKSLQKKGESSRAKERSKSPTGRSRRHSSRSLEKRMARRDRPRKRRSDLTAEELEAHTSTRPDGSIPVVELNPGVEPPFDPEQPGSSHVPMEATYTEETMAAVVDDFFTAPTQKDPPE